MRTAGRSGTVQSGEENAQRDLIHVYKLLMGGKDSSGAQRQDMRQ